MVDLNISTLLAVLGVGIVVLSHGYLAFFVKKMNREKVLYHSLVNLVAALMLIVGQVLVLTVTLS